MRFTSVQGQLASDWSFSGHSKGMTLVEADAAVPVGTPVVTDTGSTTGDLVIPGTGATGFRFRGVYTGSGGSGAKATLSGLEGNAAVDGDIILVQRVGACTALVNGNSSAVADGAALEINNSAVFVVKAVAVVAGYPVYASALEAVSADGAAHPVYLSL